jgi:TolA-binding protein
VPVRPVTPDPSSTQSATRSVPAPPVSGEATSPDEIEDLDRLYERAMANYTSGSYVEAERDFQTVEASKSPLASNAAFYVARTVRARSGCQAAIPYFNKVRTSHAGSAVSADATWEQADCHRILGQSAQARELWLTLQKNKSYQDRATTELQNQGESANSGGDASQSRKRNDGAPEEQEN